MHQAPLLTRARGSRDDAFVSCMGGVTIGVELLVCKTASLCGCVSGLATTAKDVLVSSAYPLFVQL